MSRVLNWLGWGQRETLTERLQFRCSKEVKEKLIALKVNTGAKSLTEICQWGFSLVHWGWNVRRDGGKILIEWEDGEQREMILPWEKLSSGNEPESQEREEQKETEHD